MKRIDEFDSLLDFGYTSKINSLGKVEFVRCDPDFTKLSDSDNSTLVYANGDLTPGKFFDLQQILSGGVLSVDLNDAIYHSDQAKLSMDYSDPRSLAYFGSVYSTVLIGINKIKENYPNGFVVLDAVTGINTIIINNENTYFYGAGNTSISDYTEFELVQAYDGSIDQVFQINSETSLTGGTFSLLFLDDQPSVGGLYSHYVQPKSSALDKFYSTLTPYELDLLVPPFDRTNAHPRDSIATNNILFTGDDYDNFVETELDWAIESDSEVSNILWRKLYPDGQKNLDSDDALIQKLVLSMAMNFDMIMRYQGQLKYQQTINYENYNHISKNLVELLSSQWNFSLGHNLNQDDYSEFIYSQYENYVTGQSQQKLSSEDVNFEIWRRVLSNVVTLYKKKGTIEAIKYVANIYGLPEALLWVDEFVNAIGINNNKEVQRIVSESNIVVPINGSQWYIANDGTAKELPYKVVSNTKYLNVNISPFDAIEFDFYDWGWENHPDIIDFEGKTVSISSSTEITKNEYFSRILNATIPSDGSAKYADSYPILESEGDYYYNLSVNKYSLSNLEPYMDFLDDNWNVLISNLIPASSKVISIGNLYRNPMWRREKYKWISELDPKQLPFNETVAITLPSPVVEIGTKASVTIDPVTPAAYNMDRLSTTIDLPSLSSAKQKNMSSAISPIAESAFVRDRMSSTIDVVGEIGEYLIPYSDSEELDFGYSSETLSIFSPLIEPISGQYGTIDYINYGDDALVVSNENTFDVVMSAYNLSDSGYSGIRVDVFKKSETDAVVINEEIEYAVLSVKYENNQYGSYKVSSVEDIDQYDMIKIKSDYLPFMSEFVQVVHIDSGRSIIKTSPAIGLYSLPVGPVNNRVDWFDFLGSGALTILRNIDRYSELSYDQMIGALLSISEFVSDGTLDYFGRVLQYMRENGIKDSISQMFMWFTHQDIGIIYASILVLEYVKSPDKSLRLHTPDLELVNNVSQNQSKAIFNRVVNFFNWASPDQTIEYDNFTGEMGDFVLPEIDVYARGDANDYSTTGTVTIGGLNYLNSNILSDKSEYFYRYKISTHAPNSWGDVDGLARFPISGGSIIESNYDISYINGIKYYGRYFMFMRTPNVPIATVQNLDSDNGSTPVTFDSSVSISWNGTGDADRFEIQYYPDGTSVPSDTDTGYTGITDDMWLQTAVTTSMASRDGANDDYVYNVQTTLLPDTYYWWRVKNFRNKINMFGHNLEYFTTTEPKLLKTGGFSGGGHESGEIPEEPTPPDNVRPTLPKDGFTQE